MSVLPGFKSYSICLLAVRCQANYSTLLNLSFFKYKNEKNKIHLMGLKVLKYKIHVDCLANPKYIVGTQ